MSDLKTRRLALNLTQAEIAETFGVSGNTWARWERGEGKPEAAVMLELALEALETRQLLDSPEFNKKRAEVKKMVQNNLNEMKRERVKHPSSGK